MTRFQKLTNIIDKYIINGLQHFDKSNFWNNNKIFFFKELSSMIKWGLWLIESLSLIQESSDNYAMKEIASWISDFLYNGKTLSYSFKRFPEYFTEWDINIVMSWEKTWNLWLVLQHLADEYTYIKDIKQKYQWALTYPAILIIISLITVVAMFAFVLPNIFQIVTSFPNVEIPMTTLILQWISDFTVNNWKFLLIFGVFFFIIMSLYLSTEKWKKKGFDILISLPLIWQMTQYYYLIKFCRYMKLMLISGMDYVSIFQILRDIMNLPPYQDLIDKILWGIQRWETIYENIKDKQKILPPNATVLIKVWEESASLGESLDNILSIYEWELNAKINGIAKVIEPIMLVFIGIIVVFVAIWVFWLILQIMEWVWM